MKFLFLFFLSSYSVLTLAMTCESLLSDHQSPQVRSFDFVKTFNAKGLDHNLLKFNVFHHKKDGGEPTENFDIHVVYDGQLHTGGGVIQSPSLNGGSVYLWKRLTRNGYTKEEPLHDSYDGIYVPPEVIEDSSLSGALEFFNEAAHHYRGFSLQRFFAK